MVTARCILAVEPIPYGTLVRMRERDHGFDCGVGLAVLTMQRVGYVPGKDNAVRITVRRKLSSAS